jgi:endonuclease-3
MRTSKISRDTAKVIKALAVRDRPRRQTRSLGASIRSFAFTDGVGDTHDTSTFVSQKVEEDNSNASAHSSELGEDIEDALSVPPRKQRRGNDSPATTVTALSSSTITTRISPRKRDVKTEEIDDSNAKLETLRRVPARRITTPDGSVTIHPPSNWEEVYDTILRMRKGNPTAPVDTMGCEDLYHVSSSPTDRRFQTLTALMLSSQTKDTVTASAMQRLHNELVPSTTSASSNHTSCLTLENILKVSPTHLNELIGAVGFHNNKTKYIKAAALILRDQYNSDIPNTPEGLMRLPGVGPKMAYLCMSAAWGIDVGIGVDVHVHRITNLWGWHKTKTPEETRMWLEGWLPKDKWHEINKMLVGLGQTVCLPVGRRCDECDLGGTGLCPGEVRVGKVKRRKMKDEVTAKKEGDMEVLHETVVKEEVT